MCGVGRLWYVHVWGTLVPVFVVILVVVIMHAYVAVTGRK